ncbi:MAG: hypothetical protein GTO12_01690 [Proteobacteria bacterium]|nr:hypothetical protein [Pseudomonadota bacterium]
MMYLLRFRTTVAHHAIRRKILVDSFRILQRLDREAGKYHLPLQELAIDRLI